MSRATLLILVGALMVGCQGRPPAPKAPAADQIAETPTELAELADIPIYPGAKLPEGKSNIRMTSEETRYEIIATTPDAPEKVSRFYKTKLPVSKIPDTKSLMGVSPKGRLLKIDIGRTGKVTTIDVVSIEQHEAKKSE